MSEMQVWLEKILLDHPLKIILSDPLKESPYKKIQLDQYIQKQEEVYQAQKMSEKQVFHQNVKSAELLSFIMEMMNDFKQVNLLSEEFEYQLKISKKGKLFYSKALLKQKPKLKETHNRQKNYLIQEGMKIPALIELGVLSSEGKVIHSMYDKFKQINRYIELVDDVLKNEDLKQIRILDFGCGKSYLTFVLYYYLVEIKKLDAHIIGLDLKADVIEKCNAISKKYNYDNLHFELGDIANYHYTDQLDMVITLHACDTATDYALYNAIKWNARFILSVPCCQHEVNQQISSNSLSGITRYGLIKERVSALMTDSIRANCLIMNGYQTQVIEFIDLMHSPKNILIRAVKKPVTKDLKQQAQAEIEAMMKEFTFTQTLYELLKTND